MKRNVFNQYLQNGDFRELFITEMGWNNPSGTTMLPEYIIDERAFRIEQIADRSGFQILLCEVDEIPTSSVCKKLDTKLRLNAENYICIFMVPDTMHHLWAAPVKKVEKRDIVLVEYDTIDKAGFLFEKMEGLSFSLDETPTILDIIAKVQSAFIINSEKITKDFYTGFKKEHTNFAKFITGIDDQLDDKDNKNKQWYTSVMLNRLMFCYFIQKKGFLDGDVNYLRHKLEWTQQNEGEDRFFCKFYKGFLVSLFHDGLNAPHHSHEFETIYGRIPYLNGGMFDVHKIEHDYAGLDIADEAFQSLFDFFDKWHWHLDDRMTATGRDINPDVLGYIFEQYINDRAQMGAYYTKEDITEYIGRNTIIPYLMDAVRQKDEKRFKANGELWQFLRDSSDRYIYDAVKKGHGLPIPEKIAIGIDTTQPNLLERRKHWNDRTPEPFALPTEIWRETIERLQRYNSIKTKIENGEITAINDFITYNLDIRQFVYDYLAHTQDHLFVEYFYNALQRVTILDPTCGSGAFLFAALNILEPLYEVCIARMQEFYEQNKHLFNRQLDEIENKYRSNIQYFIYKSIILRNLYGVDLMVEATEIAKLRLFLKMVAVVDVDKRDPNLGLDPLPDIDFNIRCGNTLVGYATEKEMEDGIAFSDFFTAQEFRNRVTEEMEKVARTYSVFTNIQLTQTEDMVAFKQAKHVLKVRLTALNDLLNRQMYGSITSNVDYDSWLRSNQPFHWLAEFYEIISDHGGFDVIIGNPPYVEHTAVHNYKIENFVTKKCGNLFANCSERSFTINKRNGRFGFIVPISVTCSKRMRPLQKILLERGTHFSNWSWRPSKLFDGNKSANLSLTILICTGNSENYVSTYNRWYTETRANVFNKLSYTFCPKAKNNDIIPKIGSSIEESIYKKLCNLKRIAIIVAKSDTENKLYYKRTGGLYWKIFTDFRPELYLDGVKTFSSKEEHLSFYSQKELHTAICSLWSDFYWWWYQINSDVRNNNPSDLLSFPIVESSYDESLFITLSEKLQEDLTKNSVWSERKFAGSVSRYKSFIPKLSKEIINKIDISLNKYYGFTEEELDFIINYDIKYRMGDELNEE